MRKTLAILVVALFAVAACKKDKHETVFSTETNNLFIGADETERKVWVKQATDWEVEIGEDAQEWLSYEKILAPEADTIVYLFTVNEDVAERRTTAVLRDIPTGREFDIKIRQEGQNPNFYFSLGLVTAQAEDTEASAVLSINATSYELVSKPAWIMEAEILETGNEYEKEVRLTLEENASLGFRKDSVLFDVEWKTIAKTERVSLPVLQLGTGSLETDSETLELLYEKLDGANWNLKWNIGQDIATWEGVILEDTRDGAGVRVVGLQLNGAGLKGELPKEIASLSYLRILWLNDNPGMTGMIPEEIGDLVLMENLRLGNTSLTGSLPDGISRMKSLTNLSVSGTGENGITGTIPESYGVLERLSVLDLSENDLTGGLPAWLGGLPNLGNVFLQGNRLSGTIPQPVKNCYNWMYWGVSENICPQRGDGFSDCGE